MTARLCQAALGEWAYVDGYAVSVGIDLLDLPLTRFTNFIWWLMTKDGSKADVDKMRTRLWRPPVGTVDIPKNSPWSPESETSAFGALKAGLGLAGPKPNSGTSAAV